MLFFLMTNFCNRNNKIPHKYRQHTSGYQWGEGWRRGIQNWPSNCSTQQIPAFTQQEFALRWFIALLAPTVCSEP